MDYPLLRQISSICNQLPTMDGVQFSEEFMRVSVFFSQMIDSDWVFCASYPVRARVLLGAHAFHVPTMLCMRVSC